MDGWTVDYVFTRFSAPPAGEHQYSLLPLVLSEGGSFITTSRSGGTVWRGFFLQPKRSVFFGLPSVIQEGEGQNCLPSILG